VNVLTTQSQVQCTHGGSARIAAPGQGACAASSGRVLMHSDQHVVQGCPFVRGTQPSPCVRVSWQAGSVRVLLGGQRVLTTGSLGTCWSAEGAQQGLAVVVAVQGKAQVG
jgi:hypothetical protein